MNNIKSQTSNFEFYVLSYIATIKLFLRRTLVRLEILFNNCSEDAVMRVTTHHLKPPVAKVRVSTNPSYASP